jgi:hypothetical protein
MFLSENWLHFLHFSENSQRHHYAADASVYLVNIKRQIYYAHRQKNVLLTIVYIYVLSEDWLHFLHFLPLMLVFT